MPAAARHLDTHACPLVDPASGTPHTGTMVVKAASTSVFIEKVAAAVMNDSCLCPFGEDKIIGGSTSVFIGGMPAARLGDPTSHGGSITKGAGTVNIG
ncbi:MAG: PAAR domain-containing protein [Bacteroidota bacterium]